jgi:hypothetical protein
LITDFAYHFSVNGNIIGDSIVSICNKPGDAILEHHSSQSKSHYVGGHRFNLNSGLLIVNTHIHDCVNWQNYPSNLIEDYLSNHPSKVFIEVAFEDENKKYKSVWFNEIPPVEIYKTDLNAKISYVQKDTVVNPQCIDFWKSVPIELSYKGWLFDEMCQDSIFVDSLKVSYFLKEL